MYSRQKQSKSDLSMLMLVTIGFLLFGMASTAWGGDSEKGIDWWVMIMGLFGGLALFLYGMEQMANVLKALAGERMKDIMRKLSTNRFMSALTGALVTAVIQSSSVTTVLVVGFVTAGLMSMAQSIAVIMGANIGTTITAQILAFKVTKVALLMIGAGFFMLFVTKQERIRQYGTMLMGLGLIFFSMGVMSDAMKPLRTYQPFLDLMATMENPLVGILVAVAFTGLIRSPSAATGIIIVMASQGFITLPAGIALAFGVNIGTCVTALLASVGKPREAVRAALVHVFFNVAGVLIWLGLIPYLVDFATWFSPSYAALSGTERLAAETPRQIANAQTFFNVANTIIFIGLTGQIARLVEWLVPDKPLDKEPAIVKARYLDEALLSTPSLALDRVRLEVLHMGEKVQDMLTEIMPAIISGDKETLEKVRRMDDNVDILHKQMISYLGKISSLTLTTVQTKEFLLLMEAVNDLENIGDTIETNLVVLGHERFDQGVSISQPTQEVLNGFYNAVTQSVQAAVQAVSQKNMLAAHTVTSMKDEISQIADSAAAHQAERLVAEEPNRIPAYTIEIDIIEKLKRIYYFAKRMAKTVEEQQPEEKAA